MNDEKKERKIVPLNSVPPLTVEVLHSVLVPSKPYMHSVWAPGVPVPPKSCPHSVWETGGTTGGFGLAGCTGLRVTAGGFGTVGCLTLVDCLHPCYC